MEGTPARKPTRGDFVQNVIPDVHSNLRGLHEGFCISDKREGDFTKYQDRYDKNMISNMLRAMIAR